MENVKIVPTYGVRVVSERVRATEITGDSGGGYISSGRSDAGDLLLILAGTYGGAAIGYLVGIALVVLLSRL